MSFAANDTYIKILGLAVPRIIENVEARLMEDAFDVKLFVSFECDDEDELEDVFQAVIDVMCQRMVVEQTVWKRGSIVLWYPGAVGDEDMYEEGESAKLQLEPANGCIDVSMKKRDRSTQKWRVTRYVYEI